MAEKKSNRNTFIIAGLLVLTIIAFLLIHFFGDSGPDATGNETADQLIEEIMELESSILEMDLVSEQQSIQLDQTERLLEEKYLEINALTERLEELERQGAVDKSVIQRLRGQIAEAKGQLLDQYKKEIDVLVIDNSRMTRLIDSVSIVMDSNDSLMEVVMTENIALQTQVDDCGNSGPDPTPAARTGLFAENISILARKNANAAFERGGLFPQTEMESIKVNFNLVGYGDIPAGLKVLHLVLKNGKGDTYQNPGSSGSWIYDGVNKSFSMQIKAEYQGIAQELSQIFSPTSGTVFDVGANILEIYFQNQKIGEKRFLVKS